MTAISFPPPSPVLIVFGRDHAGKPHASWFDQASAELATKAAGMMNMRAVPVEGDPLRELAGTLARGRVFSSGRAFTPFVKGKIYERLVELTRDLLGLHDGEEGGDAAKSEAAGSEADQPTADDDKPAVKGKPAATPAKGHPRPSQAGDIGLGSLVLAEDRSSEGWFEAEVIGINGSMLTLKWRDYNEPTIVRRAAELGFLPAIAEN